jgi:nucleoid-associated protein YgaU
MPDPNVTKIVIKAYRDKNVQNSFVREFVVPINPEQLSQKFEVKSNQQQSSGNQGTSNNFGVTLPEELKLDFYLDNTNTIEGNVHQGTPVPQQVRDLLATVYYVDGQSHKPLFLKIGLGQNNIFGDNKPTFDCSLKSLDINYVLFTAQGEPLRAKVSASFGAHVEDRQRVREEDRSSPTRTHVRTTRPNDRLWLMTNEIYGDPRYVMQVARENDLDTFRQIKPGSQVFLPPFDRTEIN